MSRARFRSGASALHQRGFALIIMLALAAMIAAYLISIGLSRSSSELASEREDRNMSVLRQAKAALIAYAASEEWQAFKGQQTNQPGALPCPDVTNSGNSSGVCTGTAENRVGRLPYKSIGADELRDASGELLWYAVSSNFYKTTANIINSDTQGLLTVTGTAPASNVVAIVFAPGPPVLDSITGQLQDRGTNVNRMASYLEGFTPASLSPGLNDYTFASSAIPSSTFNDRLLVITEAELMAAVEPIVAARIQRDIKPFIKNYSDEWGWNPAGTILGNAYPFPALFAPGPGDNSNAPSAPTPQPRAQNAYVGDTSQTTGLLPIASATYPWTSGSGTGSFIGGIKCDDKPPGGGGNCPDNLSCAKDTATPPNWVCSFRVRHDFSNPRFQLTGQIANAGMSFPTLPDASAITGFDTDTGLPMTLSTPTIRGTMIGSGVGTVIFEFTWLFSDSSHHNVVITVPAVVASPWTSTALIPLASASNASPISIATTGAPHGLFSGARVNISGVTGNPAANGDWNITVLDSTRFTLDGSTGSGAGTGGNALPASAWFIKNEWFRQTWYAVSPGTLPGGGRSCIPLPAAPSCLTVSKLNSTPSTLTSVRAALVLAGRAFDGSTRPSTSPANYLEGANLTAVNGTTPFVYEHRAGTPTSINDRVVVLSP